MFHKFNQFLGLFQAFKLFNVIEVSVKTAYIECEWFDPYSSNFFVRLEAPTKLHLRRDISLLTAPHYRLLEGLKATKVGKDDIGLWGYRKL